MKENPGWWPEVTQASHAYSNGLMPEPGGTGNQPCLYLPTMVLVDLARSQEQRLNSSKPTPNTPAPDNTPRAPRSAKVPTGRIRRR